jgi:hypothetical protein
VIDRLIDSAYELNEKQSSFIIRGPCAHAPV